LQTSEVLFADQAVVMRSFCLVIHFVIHSFCHSVNRITDERGTDVDQAWQTWARGDPLEVINFWLWSGYACGFRITFWLSSPLQNRGFLDIC